MGPANSGEGEALETTRKGCATKRLLTRIGARIRE